MTFIHHKPGLIEQPSVWGDPPLKNLTLTLPEIPSFKMPFVGQNLLLSSPIGGPQFNNFSFVDTNTSDLHLVEMGVSQATADAIAEMSGKTWVGSLDSNGNREVGIMIPKGVDYSKPFELIYYFHGLSYSNEIQKLANPELSLKDEIESMVADKQNVIVVIPNGPQKPNHYNWFHTKNTKGKEDMAKFQTATIDIIKQKLDSRVQIASITAKGHSAGGFTMMNALKEGKLQADRIDFLDASYGYWATSAYQYAQKQKPDVEFNVFYIPGSKTHADAKRLAKYSGVHLISSLDKQTLPMAKKGYVSHRLIPQATFTYRR